MTVLFIFRDPARGGTSVEEIYGGLIHSLKDQFDIQMFYYKDKAGVMQNITNIRKLNPDLIHVTSDVYFIVLFLRNFKTIITIHDIGRYKELQGWKKLVYRYFWLHLPMRSADKVVTVSDYTSNDIIQYFGKKVRNKIVRIYNPVPLGFVPTQSPIPSSKPNLLQVGTLPNKNIENVILALENINCHLTILGKLSADQKALLELHKIDFTNLVGISFSEVRQEYVKADIVLFISVYEGFGMPVIEANATGRPVITANNSSLPEIAGKAALFVEDITSIDEIRSKITSLIEDRNLRERLVKDGFENVKRFEFTRIASEYLKLYESFSIN
jgi:glycosyltransferase involved in cell wall biosynthesis